MSRFGNLSRLAVNGDEVVDYEMPFLEGSPIFQCKPATEQNKPYHRALLKLTSKLAKRLRGRDADPQTLRESRGYDVKLFPQHVVVGWRENEGPIDADGNRVPYTPEDCADFIEMLAQMAPDVFDEWRNWLSQPANFRPEEPTRDDGEALGES